MIGLSAAAIVAAVLWLCVKASRRVVVDDRPLSAADRRAQWRLRMGEHLARQEFRQESVRQLFDQRAQVQAKISPRLPK